MAGEQCVLYIAHLGVMRGRGNKRAEEESRESSGSQAGRVRQKGKKKEEINAELFSGLSQQQTPSQAASVPMSRRTKGPARS